MYISKKMAFDISKVFIQVTKDYNFGFQNSFICSKCIDWLTSLSTSLILMSKKDIDESTKWMKK